jgi:hypothetical protein
MKRPPHHFVVEVRRQRRSTNGSGKSWLENPRFSAAVASETAAAVVPEAKPAETPPASIRPQGRILPNLAEIVPVAAPETAEPAPRRRRRVEPDSEPVARPSPSRTLVRADVMAQPAPRAARKAPKNAAEPHQPPPREAEAIETLANALAAQALSKARPEPCGESSQSDVAEARRARHRRILERYVHGAALKPGERWKRRAKERK